MFIYNKKDKINKVLSNKSSSILEMEAAELNLTPLQVGAIALFGLEYHHVVATVLHFLDLGIIDLTKTKRSDGTIGYRFGKKEQEFCNYYLYTKDVITPEKKEKLRKKQISVSEIYVIDKIVFKYYNYVNADRIYEFYDNYDDYSKLYSNSREVNEIKELHYDLDIVNKIIRDEFLELQLLEIKKNKKYLKTTKLFWVKVKQLKKYRRKLLKDTFLSERSIENIHLWGEHLIYGVAFNVCRTSIEDAIEIYKGRRKK